MIACTIIWFVCLTTTFPIWIYSTTVVKAAPQRPTDISNSPLSLLSLLSSSSPSSNTSHYSNAAHMSCAKRWPEHSSVSFLWSYFELLVGFIGPILIMTVSYTLLLNKIIRSSDIVRPGVIFTRGQVQRPSKCVARPRGTLRQSQGSMQAFNSGGRKVMGLRGQGREVVGSRGQTNKRRVTKMIFLVSVIFVVCWTPYHIGQLISVHGQQTARTKTSAHHAHHAVGDVTSSFVNLYYNVSVTSQPGELGRSSVGGGVEMSGFRVKFLVVMNVIVQVLPFLSSCCNPFIYYISSSNFREYTMID